MPQAEHLAVEPARAERPCGGAEAAVRARLALAPGDADAHIQLGRVLESLGRAAGARDAYRDAVRLDPSSGEAQLHLGLASLLLGDYAAGWPGYEWRLRLRGTGGAPRPLNLPRWDGSDPAGRTIVVQAEPGVGETLQFARYLPLLSGRGADVVLVCPRPLVRLFWNMPGVCVVADGDPPPRADAFVPIGSLPLVFETTPATVPTFGSYLRPHARLAPAWRERLRPPGEPGRTLIGVACAPDPTDPAGPSEALATLPELKGVRYVPVRSSLAPQQPPDLSPHNQDFADTAALLSQLDLVIAEDASPVAHLAGALGKRCWTLVRFAPDWAWGLSAEDSSWYPSMRLFRQPAAGDWASVIGEVAFRLKQEFASNHATLAA